MTLERFLNEHRPIVQVTVTEALGSTPREAGTVMFVSGTAEYGTIGGGQLEYLAIERARKILTDESAGDEMAVPLGPEIGQCCGGRVVLTFRRMNRANVAAAVRAFRKAEETRPEVYIFGAGHVGRALADYLSLLPVRPVLIDERADELAKCSANIDTRHSALPDAEIRIARPGAAYVILTHDHALDFLLVAETLARGDAAYVGMIGSATKRAKLLTYCRAEYPSLQTSSLICPIGSNESGDKRPEVIAAFVAAEILEVLTRPVVEASRVD